MSIEWLLALDIKIFLTIIIVVGVLFAIYIIYRIKKQDDMNKQFWSEIKAIVSTVSRIDSLTYGQSIAIRFISGSIEGMPEIILIHQSADGEGNHSLNRDIV